jgi:hypothetical protein
MKIILFVGNSKVINAYLRRNESLCKAGIEVYLLIMVNSLLLDPDPHFQHGSGSSTLTVPITFVVK